MRIPVVRDLYDLSGPLHAAQGGHCHDDVVAYKNLDQTCSAYLEYLDVSGLSGEYYIRVHERVTGGSTYPHVECYIEQVWLEV